MLNSILAWIAKIALGKQLVGALAWVHNKADGHRSELTLAAMALVHALKIAGVIPAATADPIETALGAILPVVLADKASKVMSTIDSVLPDTPAPAPEAPKPAA